MNIFAARLKLNEAIFYWLYRPRKACSHLTPGQGEAMLSLEEQIISHISV